MHASRETQLHEPRQKKNLDICNNKTRGSQTDLRRYTKGEGNRKETNRVEKTAPSGRKTDYTPLNPSFKCTPGLKPLVVNLL